MRQWHCSSRLFMQEYHCVYMVRHHDMIFNRYTRRSVFAQLSLFFFDLSAALFEADIREEQAPPLPSSEHIDLPRPKTIFSLRRQAKFHTAGISLAAGGKFHSPQANFTVQPPTAVEPYASLREGGGPRSGGRSPRAQKHRICGNTSIRRKAPDVKTL